MCAWARWSTNPRNLDRKRVCRLEHPFFVILSAAKDLKRECRIPSRRGVLPFAEVRVSLRGGDALSLRRENVLLPPVSKNGTCDHFISQVPFFCFFLFIISRYSLPHEDFAFSPRRMFWFSPGLHRLTPRLASSTRVQRMLFVFRKYVLQHVLFLFCYVKLLYNIIKSNFAYSNEWGRIETTKNNN